MPATASAFVVVACVLLAAAADAATPAQAPPSSSASAPSEPWTPHLHDIRTSARLLGDDMETVAARFTMSYFGSEATCVSSCAGATKSAASQAADGSWSDVNYHDQSRVEWAAMTHWSRLVTMAEAFNCGGCGPPSPSSPYNSTDMLGHISNGLNFWVESKLVNPNWWWNSIGVPLSATKVYMLLSYSYVRGNALTQAQIDASDAVWKYAHDWPTMTGENKVWTLTTVVQQGLLHRNESVVADAFKNLFTAVVVQTTEEADGIMIDGSFHQHGPQLQSCSYGAGFLQDVANIITLAHDTAFELSADQLAAYATFVLDGEQWMTRVFNGATSSATTAGAAGAAGAGGAAGTAFTVEYDLSCKGREVTRAPGSLAFSGAASVGRQLANLTSSPRAAEFATLADRWTNGPASKAGPLSGNRHFWLSDYQAHHRPGFFTSVRMFSKRMYNAECVNEEGQLSWHSSDGLTAIYVDGHEYEGIFPVWDWTKLPGITAWQDAPEEKPCGGVKQMGTQTFVGGVSDGTYGAAAFDFRTNNFYGTSSGHPGPVMARKSWFFFDQGFVALGANITATPTAAALSHARGLGEVTTPTVTTTANQANLRGPVTVSGGATLPTGVHTLSNVSWVWHDGVTYMTLARPGMHGAVGTDVIVSNMAQNGSWHRINTPQSNASVTRDVFTLQYPHGMSPSGESYAYAVVPQTSPADARDMEESLPVTVVANEAAAQAVMFSAPAVPQLQVVVYDDVGATGVISGGTGFTLSDITGRGLLMVRPLTTAAQVQFSASDPTNNSAGAVVKFTIDRSLKTAAADGDGAGVACVPATAGRTTEVTIVLPSGLAAGSSVVGTCHEA